MDQFISALGQRNHALFIDTRALTYEAVPLPASDVSIVIADTNKKRPEGNLTTWYNERVDECAQAVAIFQKYLPDVRALRDVSVEAFRRYEAELPDTGRKRARHVVTEDERVLESVPGAEDRRHSAVRATDERFSRQPEKRLIRSVAVNWMRWWTPRVGGRRLRGAHDRCRIRRLHRQFRGRHSSRYVPPSGADTVQSIRERPGNHDLCDNGGTGCRASRLLSNA